MNGMGTHLRRRLLITFRAASVAAGGAAAVGTLLGLLGGLAWWLELFAHFQLQYALVLTVTITAQLLLQPRWLAAVWALPLAVNLVFIVPLHLAPVSAGAPALRVLHINLNRDLQDARGALSAIASHQADIVFLQEVTPRWGTAVEQIEGYRVIISQPREDSRGVAALVRHDAKFTVLANVLQLRADLTDRPTIELIIEMERKSLALLSAHMKRPSDHENWMIQRAELQAAGDWAERQRGARRGVVVIGDINATAWSSSGRILLRGNGLRNSQRGFGVQPTWPAHLPWALRIPIDHCFHSADLVVVERAVEPGTGSDHLPVMVGVR